LTFKIIRLDLAGKLTPEKMFEVLKHKTFEKLLSEKLDANTRK